LRVCGGRYPVVYLGNTLADLQTSAASFLDELAALKEVETQMATLCSTPFAAAAATQHQPSALHCLIVHIEIAVHWLVGSVGMRVIDVRRYHGLQRHSLLRHAALARQRGDAAALESATGVLKRFEATYASLRTPTTHVAAPPSHASAHGAGAGAGAGGLHGPHLNPHIEVASEIDPTELYQNAIAIAFAHAGASQETLLAEQQPPQPQARVVERAVSRSHSSARDISKYPSISTSTHGFLSGRIPAFLFCIQTIQHIVSTPIVFPLFVVLYFAHFPMGPQPKQEQPRGSPFDLSRIGAVAAHVGNLPRDSIISATLPIFISRAFEEVSST
jgi:hypothetical protein